LKHGHTRTSSSRDYMASPPTPRQVSVPPLSLLNFYCRVWFSRGLTDLRLCVVDSL
jgi:hypothetical protein